MCILVDMNEIGSDVNGTFPPSGKNTTRRECLRISIKDDDLFEDNETFILILTLTGPSVRHEISPNTSVVQIIDDDDSELTQTIISVLIS